MTSLSFDDLASSFSADTTLGPIGGRDVGLPTSKYVQIPEAFTGSAAAGGCTNAGPKPDATQLKRIMIVVALQIVALGDDADYTTTWASLSQAGQVALAMVPMLAATYFGFSANPWDSEFVLTRPEAMPAAFANIGRGDGPERNALGLELAGGQRLFQGDDWTRMDVPEFECGQIYRGCDALPPHGRRDGAFGG